MLARSLTVLSIITAVSAVPSGTAANAAPAEVRSHADQFPIVHEGTLTNPYEGIIFGNGDLAASAQVLSHELVLNLGKNDVWDARVPQLTADSVVTQDELLASNGVGDELRDFTSVTATDYVLKSERGPTPKPAGQIRITHPGLSDTKITSKLYIANGILNVEYAFPHGTLSIETFVHRAKNCVLLKLSADGRIPWITLGLEKTPDRADGAMPLPVTTQHAENRSWSISQTIPGGFGVSDFSWHMASAFTRGSSGVNAYNVVHWPYSLEQDIELEDGASVVMVVGVATDRDGEGNSLDRAIELAGSSGNERFEQEKSEHVEKWEQFWAASAIDLEDDELEALWYRSLFGFASHLKPGAQAPGLNANVPIYDYSGWNGFYTWNHNVQKWYFPALVTNHPEWYDIFADLIDQHTPVFEYLADLIFDLEGVYVDLMTAPYAPPERAKSHPVFGRALSHTGWLSVMLFEHYEFTGNRAWLEERAYPYIAKAADFYANYLEKYQKQDGDIYPSMLLEDVWAWEPDFHKSRNTVTDLATFTKAFEIALKASDILGVDTERRERWQASLKRVPKIEYGWKDDKGWYAIYKDWEIAWPDLDEYLYHLQTSRWGNSGWLIFPGEFLEGDEEDGLAAAVRDVLRRTDLLDLPASTRTLGTFHGEANFLPFIRAGLIEKYDDIRTLLLYHRFSSGQFSPFATGEGIYPRRPFLDSWRIVENQYFPILGIAEMLLQSQGGLIRLFPFLPEEQSASFQGFRARGGFSVSASRESDRTMRATITSLLGNPCRIKWEHESMPHLTENGEPVAYEKHGDAIVFETLPDAVYTLSVAF